RRILGNDADAEDAFQATFLVLVHKASKIQARKLVSNWLYGVAHNTALKARAMNRQRQAKEREAGALSKGQAAEEVWRQAQALLDEAMSGLGDKYRVPIVLCDLEGKTIKEAACHLGCPQGTVATRLTRGRVLLAKRLRRHGLTLSVGTVAAVLSEGTASSVSAGLVESTLKAATAIWAGHATAGIISCKIAALTEGVMNAMFLTKLKIASAMLLVSGLFLVGAGMLAFPMIAAQQPAPGSQDKLDVPKQKEAAGNRAKEDKKLQALDIAVIVKAHLYEVDDAFFKKVSKAKRLSREELEDLERQFLDPLNQKQPEGERLHKLLAKQKLLVTGKE